MKKKSIKMWFVVDPKGTNLPFADIKGKYHAYKTKKECDKAIDDYFFPARDMGLKAKKFILQVI